MVYNLNIHVMSLKKNLYSNPILLKYTKMILELIISNLFFQTRFGGKSHPYALVQIKNFLMEQPCAINI